MNNIVYLIQGCKGSYDSYCDWIECATLHEEVAKQTLKELQQTSEEKYLKGKEVVNKYGEEFNINFEDMTEEENSLYWYYIDEKIDYKIIEKQLI